MDGTKGERWRVKEGGMGEWRKKSVEEGELRDGTKERDRG